MMNDLWSILFIIMASGIFILYVVSTIIGFWLNWKDNKYLTLILLVLFPTFLTILGIYFIFTRKQLTSEYLMSKIKKKRGGKNVSRNNRN